MILLLHSSPHSPYRGGSGPCSSRIPFADSIPRPLMNQKPHWVAGLIVLTLICFSIRSRILSDENFMACHGAWFVVQLVTTAFGSCSACDMQSLSLRWCLCMAYSPTCASLNHPFLPCIVVPFSCFAPDNRVAAPIQQFIYGMCPPLPLRA